jgi:hypothetical protein
MPPNQATEGEDNFKVKKKNGDMMYLDRIPKSEDEFTVLDELISRSAGGINITIDQNSICSPPIEGELMNLYQIQGSKDKAGAVIKFIGKNNIRPTIVIHEFNFKKYSCQIISYILSDADIEYANDKCELKMLGLLIRNKRHKVVIAAITMSFYTFVHKREKDNLSNFISKDLSGFYAYNLKYHDEGTERNERVGGIFNVFPGKTRCVYDLIKLLSDGKVSFLY